MKNNYEILNVEMDANLDEINNAYIKAIKELDIFDKDRIKDINDAYKALSAKELKCINDLPSGETVTEKEICASLKDLFSDQIIAKDQNKKIRQEKNDTDTYLIPGTNIKKPRDRKINETNEEYNKYLENYYEKYFPTKTPDTKKEKIHNTETLKPRNRTPYETDEHYNKFLSEFYEKRFPTKVNETKDELISNTNINKPRDREPYEDNKYYEKSLENYYDKSFPKKETHKIVATKKCKNHKFLKRLLTGAILTLAGLGIIPMFTGKDKKNVENNVRTNIEQSINNDDDQEIQDMVNEIVQKEVAKKRNATVGDVIKLKEGTVFYSDSQKASPKGEIGSKYSDEDNKYIVDAVSIIDKNTNEILAVSYDGGTSTRDLIEQNNLNPHKIQKMYHISKNENELKLTDGDAKQRGWVHFDKDNYNFKKNIVETESKGKGK